MTLGDYFKSKRILITGASSGIGAEIAIVLSQLGAKVILLGRNQERLLRVAAQCAHETECIVGDLCDKTVIEHLSKVCESGPLHLAILNSGTATYETPGQFKASAFNALMQANVGTMVDCIEAVLPSLIKHHGQLALMSSLAAYGGMPQASAYGAGKAAIRVLAQSLDLDLRPLGVPVTCICPGFVRTPLTDKNSFEMPFLIEAKTAAKIIVEGLAKQKHEIHFPKRFSLMMKFMMSLPASWQYHVIRGLTRGMSKS